VPNTFELQHVSPNLTLWHHYDPSVKAELFSTAVSTELGICLVDPIPLPIPDLNRLLGRARAGAIIITNQNHWRASAQLAKSLSIEVFAGCSEPAEQDFPPFTRLQAGQKVCRTIEVIPIEGAGPGEIALYSEADGGALIFGDALINFEPYGFTFLPPKYCTSAKQMRESLKKLLNLKIERLFFAHGLPIVSRASARLHQLLGTEERNSRRLTRET
jgi:glyoxylase-like metal-dependent hydrolase (beta-lactamase superfamily II)